MSFQTRSHQLRLGFVVCAFFLGVFFVSSSRLWAQAVPVGDSTSAEESNFKPIIPEQEKAIEKGLIWLEKQQSREGSFSTDSGRGGGGGGYMVSMTSIAGLAFLSAGHVPGRGKYGGLLNKTIAYILKQQQRDGLISASDGQGREMYGHGFSMLFLAEAYGMDPYGEQGERIRDALNKGIQLTARAQSNLGGWYYTPNSGTDEGSVTITQVQALRACRNVGLEVSKRVLDRAIDYIRKSQQEDGGVAYRVGMTGSRPALSAAGAELMLMAGLYEDRSTKRILDYLRKNITPTNMKNSFDSYTHFYAAQAYHHLGGKDWERYFNELRSRLIREQTGAGNWNASGWGAGPIFDTSVYVIVLALPYEYLPIYQP